MAILSVTTIIGSVVYKGQRTRTTHPPLSLPAFLVDVGLVHRIFGGVLVQVFFEQAQPDLLSEVGGHGDGIRWQSFGGK